LQERPDLGEVTADPYLPALPSANLSPTAPIAKDAGGLNCRWSFWMFDHRPEASMHA
jgi:hypothetical protein